MTRHILITGSTDGIGKATALELASRGYDLTIHGRSPQRVEETVRQVQRVREGIRVQGVTADLASLRQVAQMAATLRDGPPLDVLINNAGVIMDRFERSEDGYEMTWAVNHLAHFFLTLLLLDHLRRPARIVNVSSMVHATAIDLERLNEPAYFDPVESYSRSKLCNLLFTYKLDRLLRGRRITVNALHPGVINSKLLVQQWGPVGAPVKEGARMPVYVATDPSLEEVSGAYFENGARRPSAAVSYDEHLQDRCWEMSLESVQKAGLEVPLP